MTQHPDKQTVADIRRRLSDRLNDHLCEMREGHDDSVTGFNEAWDVMRKLFDDIDAPGKKLIVHNVNDRRHGWIGSWEAEPLVYDKLSPDHVGRTVIYRDHGRAEAGTLTSWRDGIVFARYSRGETPAGAKAADLLLAVRSLDGDAR